MKHLDQIVGVRLSQ